MSSAGTGYFYAAKKNPTNIQHKLAFMKVSKYWKLEKEQKKLLEKRVLV